MLKADGFRLRKGPGAERSEGRWWRLLFVAVLCANLAGAARVVADEGPVTPIGRVNKSLAYQDITVEAAIVSVSRPREGGPYYVMLSQGGATVPLIYWPSIEAQMGPKVKVGNVVRAKVKVGVYQDRLQLNIDDANALEVVNPVAGGAVTAAPAGAAVTTPSGAAATPTATTAPASGAPPVETVIGKIKADWADRAVIISGTVSDTGANGKGWEFKVQDATGEIPVVLGEKAVAGLAIAEVRPGWVITVTGPVKVLDGKPALVPEVAGAVKLTRQ